MKKINLSPLQRRHLRVRVKVEGSPARPRLCLHKSLRHLYAQVIDDQAGRTLAFATTNLKENKKTARTFCNVASAKKIGADLARKAMAQGVAKVVFDRGGYRYHGVIKAFADAAREAGLQF